MRSKAPLALMEQAVMVLVFALAAVLCLRVFVWSDRTSELGAAKDMAALKAQSAAEIIKNEGKSGGDCGETLRSSAALLGGIYDESSKELTVGYLSDWNTAGADAAVYRLTAYPIDSGSEKLCKVKVEVSEQSSGEMLIEFETAWQKEGE